MMTDAPHPAVLLGIQDQQLSPDAAETRFRPLCPEAQQRAEMSDEEFWEHVAGNLIEASPPEEPDIDEIEMTRAGPCTVCGEYGACGYDVEGRPLVHPEPDDDE
jgi:hypothetical protein